MRRAVVALLGGSLLLASAVVVAVQDGRSQQFGGETAAVLATASAGAAPSASPPPSSPPVQVGQRSARLADLELPQADPPVELRLAGRSAPVVPVGVEPSGQVEVPVDVDTVGWYRHGPEPGAPAGSTVVVGHVDDAVQGLGVLADLRDLEPGAAVEVRRSGGEVVRYRVVAREQWDKGEVPLARLFDTTGPHRLVLVSCAGEFDEVTRSYSDNVAVTAVPVA